MKRRSDTLISLALLLLLVVVTAVAALQKGDETEYPALTSLSARPNGALALKRWVSQLGYDVLEDQPEMYRIPRRAKIVFVLEPVGMGDAEIGALTRWVEQGGVLIMAGSEYGGGRLADELGFSVSVIDSMPADIKAQAPLFSDPPLTGTITVDGRYAYSPTRQKFVTLLAVDTKPVLVMFSEGRGRVFLSSISYPFSNKGLKDPGNPEMVRNLLRMAGDGPVWFDEWHHGLRDLRGEVAGPDQWLQRTPVGHAILFAFGVIFVALLLQGRAFGRPVPLPREIRRRGILEHVTAIANLNRRAGHRPAVLRQYHDRVKRHLGRRYRLDPSMPDAEFVRALASYNPALDQDALLALLERLSRRDPGEGDLVKLAAEAAQWIKE